MTRHRRRRTHRLAAATPATLALAVAALAPRASAVLHYTSTANPADQVTFNTTAPTDATFVNSGWQFQGNWSSFLGTPISNNAFLTAAHVGGSRGDPFTLDSTTRLTTKFADGSDSKTIPGTDLRLWHVSTPFASFAPLFNPNTDGIEIGKLVTVFGRGTARGDLVNNGTEDKGWTWGADDHVLRWGTNTITSVVDFAAGGDNKLLRFTFDQPTHTGYSGNNEASLTRGDSGGAVFVKVGSTWKLAGINYAVYPIEFATPADSSDVFEASLFDVGGMYYRNSSGVLTSDPESATDDPSSSYASRIAASYTILRLFTNEWKANANASFNSPGSWSNILIPSSGSPAIFGQAITAPRTVTVNSTVTVASLGFDNVNRYTLAGAGSLIIDADADSSRIGAQSGSHTVSVPVQLNTNTTVDVAPGSTLTFTTPLAPTASAGPNTILTKTSDGTLEVPNFRGMSLAINNGTVKISPNGTSTATSAPTSLTMANGRLDLADNDLVLDYSASSLNDTVRNWLNSARNGGNGGNWTGGTGLTSSSAYFNPNQNTALAYAESSQLLGLAGSQTATWSGITVDATAILVKYTYYGDANLDGTVNSDDYALFDRGLTKGLTGWINGDFNYDNTIDLADLALLDRTLIQQSSPLAPSLLSEREAQFGAQYVSSLLATLPEPSLAACGFAVPVLLARRRRLRIRV